MRAVACRRFVCAVLVSCVMAAPACNFDFTVDSDGTESELDGGGAVFRLAERGDAGMPYDAGSDAQGSCTSHVDTH